MVRLNIGVNMQYLDAMTNAEETSLLGSFEKPFLELIALPERLMIHSKRTNKRWRRQVNCHNFGVGSMIHLDGEKQQGCGHSEIPAPQVIGNFDGTDVAASVAPITPGQCSVLHTVGLDDVHGFDAVSHTRETALKCRRKEPLL